MKTKNIFVAVMLAGFILQGCVTSLHPLYTSGDLVFDKRLLGSWKEGGKDNIWKMENLMEHELAPYTNKTERAEKESFKKLLINKNTYLLTFTEKGETRQFQAHLAKLGNDLFLDLFPDDMHVKNSLFEDHFIPVHTYAKVKIYDNKFELYFFNSELLYKILDQNNIRLKHESFGYYKVITASTQELQQFVTKYAHRKDLFLDPVVMTKS
jgi:hypothetical protein